MPSPLDAAPVPLVGQPVKVLGYVVSISVQCQCSPGDPFQALLRLDGGVYEAMPSRCSRCQTLYRVNAVAADPRGQLGFGFALERPVLA